MTNNQPTTEAAANMIREAERVKRIRADVTEAVHQQVAQQLFGFPIVFSPGTSEGQWYLKELTDDDVRDVVKPPNTHL